MKIIIGVLVLLVVLYLAYHFLLRGRVGRGRVRR